MYHGMSQNPKRYTDEQSEQKDDGLKKKVKTQGTHNREITTVLVRNLPPNYNHHKVRRYFRGCGSILRIDVIASQDNETKLARIEFASYDEVLIAMSRTLKKIGNHQITVEHLVDSTIWMTNFPPGSDSYTIKEFLSQYITSPILSIRFPSLAFNSRRRFAYVDLISPDEAQKAVDVLNGTDLGSYKVVVKRSNTNERTERTDSAIAEGREVVVKNIPHDISDADLLKTFGGVGQIEKYRVLSNKDDGPKYAFITFVNKDSTEKALALNGHVIGDNPIHVSKAMKKAYLERQEVKRLLSTRKINPKVLGLYPISDLTTPLEVASFIAETAKMKPSDVDKVLLASDHEGALVMFKSETMAAKASLACNGVNYKGKTLHCVSTNELSRHRAGDRNGSKPDSKNDAPTIQGKTQEIEPESKSKMSNDDFRRMFLSK